MEQKIKRRSLLGGIGAAAAGLLVVKSAPAIKEKALELEAKLEPEGDGYRLTEHIKKYYRSTTI